MSRFRDRILAPLLAALLPLFVLGTALVIWVAAEERARIEAAARAHVRSIVVRLDQQIGSHIAALQVLAASPALDGGDLAAFREHARRARESQPFWRNILLANAEGMQVLNLRYPDAIQPVRVSGLNSFKRTLTNGRPQIGGVSEGPRSGDRAVPVRVPIGPAHHARYVLTAAIELGALAELLRDAPPKGWNGVILDQEGRIVARTSDGALSAGQRGSEDAYKSAVEGRDGEFRLSRSREGEEVVAVFLRSSLTGWTVHGGFPYAALSVLQTRSVVLAAGGVLASLLLAGLLFWLVLREDRTGRG